MQAPAVGDVQVPLTTADSDAITYSGAIAHEDGQAQASAVGDGQLSFCRVIDREDGQVHASAVGDSQEPRQEASDTISCSSAIAREVGQVQASAGANPHASRPEDTITYSGAIDVAARRAELRLLEARARSLREALCALPIAPGSQDTAMALVRDFEADLYSMIPLRRPSAESHRGMTSNFR